MDHPDDMNISGDLENLDTSTEITTAQLLAQLKDIWRNERLAPELLPHHEEIVELLLDQIKEMDKNVDKAKAKEPYRCHIHKMELDRVRYMLSNYLRCRLEKLENYTIHYRSLPQNQREILLTPAEDRFLTGCHDHTDRLIESSLAPYFPALPDGGKNPILEKFLDAWKKNPLRPKLDTFVFVKPKETLDGLILDSAMQDGPVTLEKGGQYMLRYSSVREFVIDDKLILM